MYMRVIHRYLGFFLTGVMAVYAISGIVLTFRDTDFLKKEVHHTKQLQPNIAAEDLGKALEKGRFRVDKEEGDLFYFQGGTYNKVTGVADYTDKAMPYVIDNMNKLHKMSSSHPLYWFSILFGLALLFFVVSSFWMFLPHTPIFKKGLYFTLGGAVLTLILLFV